MPMSKPVNPLSRRRQPHRSPKVTANREKRLVTHKTEPKTRMSITDQASLWPASSPSANVRCSWRSHIGDW